MGVEAAAGSPIVKRRADGRRAGAESGRAGRQQSKGRTGGRTLPHRGESWALFDDTPLPGESGAVRAPIGMKYCPPIDKTTFFCYTLYKICTGGAANASAGQREQSSMDKQIAIEGKWRREFDFEFGRRAFFTIETDRFRIVLGGGSVRIFDGQTKELRFRMNGFRYLYTGDVSPDGRLLAALENGKHFYLFSLEDLTLLRRVTLPRGYESIDGYPSFSGDGSELIVPVSIYRTGEYHYFLCRYEAADCRLRSMQEVGYDAFPAWPLPPLPQ